MASRFSQQKPPHRSHKYNSRSIKHQMTKNVKEKDQRNPRYESKKRKNIHDYRSNNKRKETASRGSHYESPREKELRRHRKDEKIREKPEDRRLWPRSLIEEIDEMLQIEDHHVISPKHITNVEWCPKFIDPDIRGHIRGGKDLLHHTCRKCRRLCLHLLGRPGTLRQCLECSGKWEKKYIPLWYYHSDCKYCRK